MFRDGSFHAVRVRSANIFPFGIVGRTRCGVSVRSCRRVSAGNRRGLCTLLCDQASPDPPPVRTVRVCALGGGSGGVSDEQNPCKRRFIDLRLDPCGEVEITQQLRFEYVVADVLQFGFQFLLHLSALLAARQLPFVIVQKVEQQQFDAIHFAYFQYLPFHQTYLRIEIFGLVKFVVDDQTHQPDDAVAGEIVNLFIVDDLVVQRLAGPFPVAETDVGQRRIERYLRSPEEVHLLLFHQNRVLVEIEVMLRGGEIARVEQDEELVEKDERRHVDLEPRGAAVDLSQPLDEIGHLVVIVRTPQIVENSKRADWSRTAGCSRTDRSAPERSGTPICCRR